MELHDATLTTGMRDEFGGVRGKTATIDLLCPEIKCKIGVNGTNDTLLITWAPYVSGNHLGSLAKDIADHA